MIAINIWRVLPVTHFLYVWSCTAGLMESYEGVSTLRAFGHLQPLSAMYLTLATV
ncbi:hypothetical protein M758_12G152200 [Ceratodon purpureus]|uniref:Uncharacterized protein n=1 Tax=Ceratodon purpureus TaxID=3225 RepID=A0A8T0GD80_CERPU|nr:hypothetical protein KC19_12G149700 [Ceratodon purpureus]KAG0599442.1 hypothetical protein M758_12G152200 [Ceratodon purpureus]